MEGSWKTRVDVEENTKRQRLSLKEEKERKERNSIYTCIETVPRVFDIIRRREITEISRV